MGRQRFGHRLGVGSNHSISCPKGISFTSKGIPCISNKEKVFCFLHENKP